MSKNLFYTVILILGIMLAGCAGNVSPTETPAPTSPPPTLAASPTVLPSATAVPPTATAVPPTATVEPSATATLEPTATPIPQPTPTAEPTLPAVPAGLAAERLQPSLWVVRVVASEGNVRTEAAANSEILAKLACGNAPVEADVAATGDATGLRWYHLVSGGWVREDIVKTYPDATAAEAAAKAAKCGAVATTTGQGAGTDYTPKVAQVWNFTQSPDNMSGTCAGGPILPPYGLVKITPQGNNLLWQSQEGIPYTFARTQPNTYSYSGPAVVGEATVTMLLQFTGTETLTMSRAYVANSEPTCTHTHYYTGMFQWASP